MFNTESGPRQCCTAEAKGEVDRGRYVREGDVTFDLFSGSTPVAPRFGCAPGRFHATDPLRMCAHLPFDLLDDEPDIVGRLEGLRGSLSMVIRFPDSLERFIPLSSMEVIGCCVAFREDPEPEWVLESMEPEPRTVPQLKAALRVRGVTFPSKARKADLQTLYENTPLDVGGDECELRRLRRLCGAADDDGCLSRSERREMRGRRERWSELKDLYIRVPEWTDGCEAELRLMLELYGVSESEWFGLPSSESTDSVLGLSQ